MVARDPAAESLDFAISHAAWTSAHSTATGFGRSEEACAKGSGHDPTTAGTLIAPVQSR